MRVNIYHEELTIDTAVVEKFVSETGRSYYGARIYLASTDLLHHTDVDDDRSAVTFWFGDRDECSAFLSAYLGAVVKA